MTRCSAIVRHHITVPRDEGYLSLVEDLLANAEVRGMERYIQHGTTTCLHHCISVSYLSYLFCRRYGLDTAAAARGGLLHDLFLYDWHTYRRAPGERLHGFEHPRKALANASRLFSLTEKERDIILHHMFPLTLTPPRSKEGCVVTMFDKYCSLMETLRQPVLVLSTALSEG